MAEKINCVRCKHYYITWDKDTPKGCKLYKFKSYNMPCHVVRENSGEDCQGFELKDHLKDKKGRVNFDDDDLW